MYYLIIDTCVWLNIGKDIASPQIISKLTSFVEREKVTLILPEIVKEEWDKHKEDCIIKENNVSVKGKLKNVKELLEFLDDDKQKSINNLLELNKEIEKVVVEQAKESIKRIEYLFNYRTTRIISPNYEVKSELVEWGVKKKAPFHKKSSVADAVIVLSSIYYVKEYLLRNTIFITENKSDFSSEYNSKIIHEDLKMKFEESGMDYFINIGEALNNIEKDTISNDVIKNIEERSNGMRCHKCGSAMDNGYFRPSVYGGLTFQYTCIYCLARFDTGEFFD